MSLRVLLGDESPAIKKVMQIALKDYGVEVKAVPMGIDVHDVARKFKPDLIFLDVLLQKKNGYDVSQELKTDPDLQKIPVILIRSSFMELDQKKFSQARSDGQLEKPFDADTIRQLVHKLVPDTKDQPLLKHLKFPDLPALEEVEQFTVSPLKTATPPPPPPTATGKDPKWNMDSFAEIPMPATGGKSDAEKNDEAWIQKNLAPYQVDVPENDDVPDVPIATEAHASQLSEEQIEAIIRAQSKEVIERIALKLVPEIAARIIREEIQRLVDEPRI